MLEVLTKNIYAIIPYVPHRKLNFQGTFVHVNSNHPKYFLTQVKKLTKKTLAPISKNSYSFKRAKPHYGKELIKRKRIKATLKAKTNKGKIILYLTPLLCLTG